MNNYGVDSDDSDDDCSAASFRRRATLDSSLYSSTKSLTSSPVGGGGGSVSKGTLESLLESKSGNMTHTVYEDTVEEVDVELVEEGHNNDKNSNNNNNKHVRNCGRFTVVAFLNSGSGGGVGKQILKSMGELLGEDMVYDLKNCKKGNLPEDNLMKYATDPFVRVLACGGDGTMGWILSSLDKVWLKILGPKFQLEESAYKGHLPLAMMPLGTGNDLARQFNWGGTYDSSMLSWKIIERIVTAQTRPLDRWRCVVVPMDELDSESRAWVPAMLGEKMRDRQASIVAIADVFKEEGIADVNAINDVEEDVGRKSIQVGEEMPETQSFDGVFCNYFSIGTDARVAFAFHKEREEHPERFKSVLGNKMKYIQNGLGIGGLLSVREKYLPPKLNGKLKILVNRGGGMEELPLPKNCRGLALLNIQSYGGGQQMTNAGSYEDGMIEVVFFQHSMGLAVAAGPGKGLTFLRYKPAAQTDRVCIKMNHPLHCQVDGEPWLQSEAIFQISYFGRSPVLQRGGGCCK